MISNLPEWFLFEAKNNRLAHEAYHAALAHGWNKEKMFENLARLALRRLGEMEAAEMDRLKNATSIFIEKK